MNKSSPRTCVSTKPRPPRRALFDLAPLELDCMNTLWPMGEGTVREIRDRLAERLPRAYTTIMTIMDRLARKGIVERRKTGRAYVYRANLSAEEARSQAFGQVVEKFFGGSKEAAHGTTDCAERRRHRCSHGSLQRAGSHHDGVVRTPSATSVRRVTRYRNRTSA